MSTDNSIWAEHPLYLVLDRLGLKLEDIAASEGLDLKTIHAVIDGGNPLQLDWHKLLRVVHSRRALVAGVSAVGAFGYVAADAGFNDFRDQPSLFKTTEGPRHVLIVGTLTVADLHLLNDLKANGHFACVACDSYPVYGSGI